MNKIIKILLAILLVAIGGVIFYKKIYLPKSTYEIYHPKKGETSSEVFGIGELSAKRIYPVGSATGGKILSVETDQGKWIKKGDIIARLDPIDLEAKIAAAKASLLRAQNDLESAKTDYEIAKEKAALAQSSYEKDLEVYKAKGISELAYEKSKTEMLTSKGAVNVAKSKIKSLNIRLTEIKEDIKGLQARLEEMTIHSPIDGFVIERSAESAQSVVPAYALVKIVDPKTLWVKAWIDERISGKVQVGQKAEITLRSRESAPLEGAVRRIAATSDPVTEEREVDVGFVKTPEPFYINEQAEVKITIETFKNLYKVPLKLLRIKNGKEGVWIDKDSKAHFLPLIIEARDGEYAGIKEGIDENTKIIVPDKKKKPLREGARVVQ